MSLLGRFTYSMPFAVALAFGKWFNAFMLALFGLLAVALVFCYRKAESVGKKVFVAVAEVRVPVEGRLWIVGVFWNHAAV